MTSVTFVRFDFEWIIHIRVATTEPQDHRASEVGGDKKWSPTFILPHVNVFVIPARIERLGALTDDCVSQGHRRGPGTGGHAPQDRTQPAAMEFDTATVETHLSAADQGNHAQQATQQRIGQGPYGGQDA